MHFTNEDYKNYLYKLAEIKKYDWVQSHLKSKGVPNFWTILEYGEHTTYGKRSSHEIRTSRMLRWLIDANETHQLGNIFAHKLMDSIGVTYAFNPEENPKIKATAEEMDIDVFYKDLSKKVYLAIELKQYAKEGKYEDDSSQLDKYESLVEEMIEREERSIDPYYIYLTPEKDEPSNDHWHALGYQDLIEMIEDILKNYLSESLHNYASDTRKILQDFKYDLKRSLDYASKRANVISDLLTAEEKYLTSALANEIEHEMESTYYDQLMEVNQGQLSKLRDVILIAKEYIYVQDHSPNDRIRVLIRKIYNYLSKERELDIDNLVEYSRKKTTTPLKDELRESFNLSFDRIEITGGKGQGLYLIDEDSRFQVYLSGEANGDFPNDHIHLLPCSKKDHFRYNTSKLANRLFNLDNPFIYEDQVQFKKEDRIIPFQQLMTDYILPAAKELNDKGKSLV